MIVELDRDPHLYPDGNIVEVCSNFFVLVQLLTENVRSGLAPRVVNPRLTALRSDERVINPLGFES